VIRLQVEEKRRCKCGKSGGVYKDDLNAVYWGDNAVPMGFSNQDLARAIKYVEKIRGDKGHVFDAFVIKSDCPTFRKVKLRKKKGKK
jgi:hypothetical protein